MITDFENRIPDFTTKYWIDDAVMHSPGLGTVSGLENLEAYYKWTQEGTQKVDWT